MNVPTLKSQELPLSVVNTGFAPFLVVLGGGYVCVRVNMYYHGGAAEARLLKNHVMKNMDFRGLGARSRFLPPKSISER